MLQPGVGSNTLPALVFSPPCKTTGPMTRKSDPSGPKSLQYYTSHNEDQPCHC